MRYKMFILATVVCLVLTACGQVHKGQDIEKIKKELSKINTYTCDVSMKVTNNRSTMVYQLKHSYKYPDKYRIEVVQPEALKGQTTICNGARSHIYHPKINQYLVTESFSDTLSYHLLFKSFIDAFIEKRPLDISWEKEEDTSYLVVEIGIPGSRTYRYKEKMWIDIKRGVPKKVEIYDQKNNPVVEMTYENFVVNNRLDDKLFEINQ